jgi:DNA-binding LacI/PurR family transcriptional regulator
MTPPLTTVKQPFREVGKCSIRTLLAEIEGHPDGLTSTVIAPELMIRESTGTPGA